MPSDAQAEQTTTGTATLRSPVPVCVVIGCERPRRSRSADWCAKHYHRWYRHGSPDVSAQESAPSVSLGRRYKSPYLPKHPLAGAGGRVYAHRAVLFDAIGWGPHACHWCGGAVAWVRRGEPNCLEVDHLNGVGDDNRLTNLVASCRDCNVTRALQARAEALREAGWWSNHDTIAALASGRRAPVVGRGA